MSGSGSTTGRRTIREALRPTPRVLHRARYRVRRGGSWNSDGPTLRSAKRGYNNPSDRTYGIGFRVGFQAVQPDTANPELELFGGASVTREAGQAWAEPGAAGHDARDGNLTSSVTVSGSVDMNTTGTYILTYSVADAAGNEANATRTVTVTGSREGHYLGRSRRSQSRWQSDHHNRRNSDDHDSGARPKWHICDGHIAELNSSVQLDHRIGQRNRRD